MSDLSNLSLFQATPEQVLESRKRSYAHWGRGLTAEEYLRDDTTLEKHEHASDGKLVTWVLVRRDDPGSLDFKCACETYHRTGLFVKKVEGNETSKLEEVACYGVASVFTPAANRGKGYGRHMMRLLHWVISPRSEGDFPEVWGSPPSVNLGDAKFSILYSDVGKKFYQKCGTSDGKYDGWTVRDANATVWNVSNVRSADEGAKTWKLLDDAEVQELWKKDAVWMESDLAYAAKSAPPGTCFFTYLPDRGVAQFLTLRAESHIPDVGEGRILKNRGVVLQSEGEDNPSIFATWTIDVRQPADTLIITRLRGIKETFVELLKKITEEARENGLLQVEVWNLPSDLRKIAEELVGAQTEERKEHLSAFKWYDKERPDQVIWINNEKFCWC